MKAFFLILASMVFFSFKQIRLPDPTDKYVSVIDNYLKSKKLKEKFLDHMSIPGGAVWGYYLKGELVLIKTSYGAEYGYTDYSYYIKNDSLVFVRERKEFLKIPEDDAKQQEFEKHVKQHTNKDGNVDCSKWPLETDDNNVYYINDSHIVDFKLRSFNKVKNVYEDEVEKKNKDLIRRYKIHVEELSKL